MRVEVHLGPGLPAFALVGLPETVVRESKERVRTALTTAGFDFPAGRITINLSPADLPKEGGRFDLPIAVGILAATGHVPAGALEGREFYGELGLNGELRETPKLVPALVAGAREGAELIVPSANAAEAGLLAGANVRLASRLTDVIDALNLKRPLPGAERLVAAPAPPWPDLKDVYGQFAAKRALEIAAAGGHGMLMIGPPGAGKTLLAQRLPGLLPELDDADRLAVASLESAAGRRPTLGMRRPFRSPQHTASAASLIGSSAMRPGELSLAHLGVLFLDELPEFPRNALEALREPLESGVVVLSRAKRTCEFPARFQLIAAMNPCPCGHAGDRRGSCRCTAQQIRTYRGRLSGPLLDRIDIHIEIAAASAQELLATQSGGRELSPYESSFMVAARVRAAQERQLRRQGALFSRLSTQDLVTSCRLDRSSRALLATAVDKLGLSARACQRVLKLARTCADLAALPDIRREDVAEAVNLRVLERTTC